MKNKKKTIEKTVNVFKRFHLKEATVNMGLFDYSIVFVVGYLKYLEDYVKWKFDDKKFSLEKDGGGYGALGKCLNKKGFVPIVWVPKKPETPKEYGTLCHECIHAVASLFDWAGITVVGETEEVFAHSVSYLVGSFLTNYK
jgi:hypothetical protein